MAQGKLTTIIIVVVLASLVYLSMWEFYAVIVNEYSDDLNFTVDPNMDSTMNILNNTLTTADKDITSTNQEYLNITGGTSDTSSNKMILNGFKVIKDVMKSATDLVMVQSETIAMTLHIPTFWVSGFKVIVLVIIIIVVVSGFFRIVNW